MSTWADRAKAAISQKGQNGTAKTDETPVPGLSSVSSVATGAVFQTPERLSSVLAVPPPAVLEKHDFSTEAVEDPDRCGWPRSSAMNGAEIDTFTARLHQFNYKGLDRADGEALAEKLLLRDRESDDRRLCPECRHLSGFGPKSWRCGNWQTADIAKRSSDAQLPVALVIQLQRCDGFAATITSTARETDDEHDHPKTPA